MGKGITFIDRDTVGDTITRVHDNTSGTARGIEGEDSLDGNVHGGHVEVSNMIWVIFSLLALGLRGASVRRTGCSTGYFRVRIPLLDWASTDVGILLSHTHHDTLVPGAPHNGGEHSPGGVVSGEPG